MRAAKAAIVLATALAATTHALTAEAPKRLSEAPEEYVFGCEPTEARAVSIRDLHDNPAAYLRQCVRIVGVSAGGRDVVADIADYYLHMTQLLEGRTEGIGIGLYASKLTTGSISERERVEVIGRAYSCEELYREAEAASDEKYGGTAPPPMLGGYCHYYGNAIVFAARSRILEPGPLRLAGAEAAKAVGDLDDLVARDTRYTEVWKRATQWFDAVRRESSPQHDDFLDVCGRLPQPTTDADARVRECRDSRRRELLILGRGRLPPIKYFVRHIKPWYFPGADDYYALGCVCRTANCEGKWPIHSIDSASPAWPYFCAHVVRENGAYKVY